MQALRVSTGELQRDGWSQPPGSRVVSYWRPHEALDVRVGRAVPPRRPRATGGRRTTTALLALEPDTKKVRALPPRTHALWRAEALHSALVSLATRDGREPPASLTGRSGGELLQGHRHATLLPLDLDDDGRLDHLLVDAPMGLEPAAVEALRAVRKTWAQDLPDIYVSLVGLGSRDDLRQLGFRTIPQLGRARVWRSFTPFVPPRHLKRSGKDSLFGQVCAEVERRPDLGAAPPIRVEVEAEATGATAAYVDAEAFWTLFRLRRGAPVTVAPGAPSGPRAPTDEPGLRLGAAWRHHKIVRQKEQRRPPTALGLGLRLSFAEPVSGPIALGYGSHLGLGQFVPEREASA